jgi:hypothetical protein
VFPIFWNRKPAAAGRHRNPKNGQSSYTRPWITTVLVPRLTLRKFHFQTSPILLPRRILMCTVVNTPFISKKSSEVRVNSSWRHRMMIAIFANFYNLSPLRFCLKKKALPIHLLTHFVSKKIDCLKKHLLVSYRNSYLLSQLLYFEKKHHTAPTTGTICIIYIR